MLAAFVSTSRIVEQSHSRHQIKTIEQDPCRKMLTGVTKFLFALSRFPFHTFVHEAQPKKCFTW
jgi:hypothetical protein